MTEKLRFIKPRAVTIISSNLDSTELEKVIDDKLTSYATITTAMMIEVSLTRCEVLALHGVQAKTCTLSYYDGGELKETKEVDMIVDDITDIIGYMNEEWYYKNSIIEDVPMYFDGKVMIELEAEEGAEVRLGNLTVGTYDELGTILWDINQQRLNSVSRLEDGELEISTTKKAKSYKVLQAFPTNKIDVIDAKIDSIEGKLRIFVIDKEYRSLMVAGVLQIADIVHQTPTETQMDTQIYGAAYISG